MMDRATLQQDRVVDNSDEIIVVKRKETHSKYASVIGEYTVI
jgi:hypothetical protein